MRTLVFLAISLLTVCAPALAADVPLANLYEDPGMGLSIHYPGDWIYQKPSQYTVVFSGPQGTAAYHSTVTLENIA